MIKKVFFLLLTVCLLLQTAPDGYAQMTDDAVMEYVKKGLTEGKSQNDLIKELLASGVTQEQAQRIRQQISVNSSASSLNDSDVSSSDRIRTYSQDIASEVFSPIQDEVSAVADDSQLQVFGQNTFSLRGLSFAPNMNIATPTDYRLGPGDEVIVDVWGSNEASIRSEISPDGQIIVPGIGPVNLVGMSVSEARIHLGRKLGQIYPLDGPEATSSFSLTLGRIRTIQVHVTGEVNVPGTYSLSSLSNIYHALYIAGGIAPSGSLRSVRLFRDGVEIGDFDLYDFLLNGVIPSDLHLKDGDVVSVPLYGSLVSISGSVKRPMRYELLPGETVQDLLSYSGGFSGDAYRNSVSIIRMGGVGYEICTVDSYDYSEFPLQDGDSLSVGRLLNRYENRIQISGAVYRPGEYELCEETHTVSQLISRADGLKGEAFTNRALLHREREDRTMEIISLDLGAILSGKASDVVLFRNDVLYVPSIHDLNDIGTVTIEGEVSRPGSFVFEENMTVEDVIMQAGGLLESASTVRIDVSRRVKNSASTSLPDSIANVYTRVLHPDFVVDDTLDFVLHPYDYVYVRRSPGYETQGKVRVSGEVLFPGEYVLTHKGERLSDIVRRSGGLNDWAYTRGARLLRNTIAEERNRTRAGMNVLTSGRDSVNYEAFDLDEQRYSVGIDLEAALSFPGSDADLVLRRGDILLIPEYVNTVKVSGNVMYPNVVAYNPGMTVKDYVEMAGGYGYRSKRNKAYVIYMNGTIARARQASRGVVEPGCEIVIPQKRDKDFDVSSLMSVATTSSSVATMLATIMNLLKK